MTNAISTAINIILSILDLLMASTHLFGFLGNGGATLFGVGFLIPMQLYFSACSALILA